MAAVDSQYYPIYPYTIYYAIWPCEIRWDDMRVIKPKQLGTVGMIPAAPRDFKTLDSLDSF